MTIMDQNKHRYHPSLIHWLKGLDIIPILKLAIPLSISQVSVISFGFIDTLTFSTLGADTLAAGGLAVAVFAFINITSIGVITAVGNQVSWAKGAGRTDELRAIVIAGIIASLVIGSLAAVLMAICEPLLVYMGQDLALSSRAQGYLLWAGIGIIPSLVFTVFRGLIVGLSNPRPITIMTILAVGIKGMFNFIILSVPFFHGNDLAWVGASTSLTFLFLAVILAVYCLKKYPDYMPTVSFPFPKQAFTECFRLGTPIGATYGVEAGLFSGAAILAGTISENALAAHHVANQFVYITFMVAVGISHATSVRIGHAAGEHNLQAIRNVAISGLFLGGITMSFMALVFLLFGHELVNLVISPDNNREKNIAFLSGQLLLIAAYFQWSDGLQNIAMGALRGLKDTKSTMYAAFFGYWIIGLPCAALWMSEGIYGVWWGLATGLSVTAIILIWRLHVLTCAPKTIQKIFEEGIS